MTHRQLLVINTLASFLPWVLPNTVSLSLLLILGTVSLYLWQKDRIYDQVTAYITLGAMTLLTSVHFFLFDQMISALYIMLIFISFIGISLFAKKENSPLSVRQTTDLIPIPISQTTSEEYELTRSLMKQMDSYMAQMLQTIESAMLKNESSSSQKMDKIHEIVKGHSIQMEKNLEMLNGKFDQNADMTATQSEAMLADLQVAISLHQDKDEKIQEVLDLLKEKSSDGLDVESMLQIIQDLQLKDIKPTNRHYVENQQMKDLFYRAFDEAQSEICLVSPWLGKWLMRDNVLMNKMESALKRGVDVKIVYGIGTENGYKTNDDRSVTSKGVASDLKRKWQKKGYPGKVKLHVSNTHFKLLMCDETFLVIGSYNFLSNQGKFGEAGSWHEAGEYAEDKDRIRQLKEIHFSF